SNTVGSALGYSKLQAAQAGAAYSNMISGFSKGAEDTKNKTEALMQATAIVASATGRSMQDTMERIQSGMRGETDAIEDLGIYVSQSM
ncbi:hypothetical protein ACKC5Q_23175, partial [Aeromonas dhakensis]|uniref:hypothetical protein n=1 Tax=Aeromonas dhakensis TaxID=196024 RepID=UPI0038B5B5D7